METETKKKWNYRYDYPEQPAKYGGMNPEGRRTMKIALGISESYLSQLINGQRRMSEKHCRVADQIMQVQRRMKRELENLQTT